MGRYNSICEAIQLLEQIRRALKGAIDEGKTSAIIRDLQDIAKDVRYGGQWEGKHREMAEDLENCANNSCAVCNFRALQPGCTAKLKMDAAKALRQAEDTIKKQAASIEELSSELADVYEKLTGEDTPREPAEWQKEIMEAVAEDKLPY